MKGMQCIQLCARNCKRNQKMHRFFWHQLLMRLPSTPHDLPNLVISTSSQTTTHQLHISFSSYCIHMALHTSNFVQVLLHACYHPSLQMSFLCFAVKAGHWFPPDSKDHTHGLGVPSFSKKSSKVNIHMRFCCIKETCCTCWCHFRFIALPCIDLFGSSKNIWNTLSKAMGVEYPPTCSPTVYHICHHQGGGAFPGASAILKATVGWSGTSAAGWHQRWMEEKNGNGSTEHIGKHSLWKLFVCPNLSLLAQVWNKLSNLPTITSHAVCTQIKILQVIIGGWCKSHGHECYAFV